METLKDIGECISCGKKSSQTLLNRDHLYPKCMIGPGKLKYSETAHPFYQVVYQDNNLYRMCIEDHDRLDSKKCASFLGLTTEDNSFKSTNRLKDIYRGDPVALVLFLMDNYPITGNRKLFDRQIYCITETNALFIKKAKGLNGEFPEYLRTGYQEAAKLAKDFNKKLASLQPPSFVIGLPSYYMA